MKKRIKQKHDASGLSNKHRRARKAKTRQNKVDRQSANKAIESGDLAAVMNECVQDLGFTLR